MRWYSIGSNVVDGMWWVVGVGLEWVNRRWGAVGWDGMVLDEME